ncbi:MAG: hypothetical protein QM771_20295 [Nitrospira sp.]
MTKHPVHADPTTSESPAHRAAEGAVYRYEPSGITERSGHIPSWLKVILFGLVLWGIYYGVRYWNSY